MIKTLHGLHINNTPDHYYNLIRDMQPSVVVFLHPKEEHITKVREISPDTIIVGRMYKDDGEYARGICNDPVGFAEQIHQEVLNTGWAHLVDYVQTHNEVCQQYHWVDGSPPSEIERKANFDKRWMQLADESGVYKCAVIVSSVGQPSKYEDDNGHSQGMVELTASYAGQHGHAVLVHEYGWPDFWSPDSTNYIGRYYNYFWSRFKDEYAKKAKVIFGEFGVDKLIVDEKGGYKSTGLTKEQYAQHLNDIHFVFNEWRKNGMNFVGAAHYCLCNDDWSDYDITEPMTYYVNNYLPEVIVEVGQPSQPKPPEPPEGEPPMIPDYVKIYDNGKEITKEEFVKEFGPIEFIEPDSLDECWVPVRLDIRRDGGLDFKVRTLQNGQPSQNNVAFSWPDAPTFPKDGCKTSNDGKAIFQGTDSNGYTAFGLGTNAWYAPPNIGPHDVWICSPGIDSVIVKGVGWLANTNHDHFDVVFALTKIDIPPTDPPTDPPKPPDECGCGDECDVIKVLDKQNRRMYDIAVRTLTIIDYVIKAIDENKEK